MSNFAKAFSLSVLSLCVTAALAQPNDSSSLIATSSPAAGYTNGVSPVSTGRTGPFSTVGLGVQIGLLGPGIQIATPLSSHLNLRAGGNMFQYTQSGSNSGVNYNANLRFQSAEASVDWFPFRRSFHISPGALVYNGNQITGKANIPGGSSFTLNGMSYVSDPADPVNGSGSLHFAKAAPKITIGWGSILPRAEHRVSMPFDIGFAYMGQPTTALNFTGSVCYSGYCQSIANDPQVQANVAAEQQKFQKDATYARFFPLLSTGFAFRF